MKPRCAWLLLAALASLRASPGEAQDRCFTGSEQGDGGCVFSAPRWVGEFATFSANSVIGGLTAGLVRRFRGGSFGDGFVRGIAGGALSYAGKRLASERFWGAGFAGREISAAGASAARNAAAATSSPASLTLPVGPLWLDIETRGSPHFRARVDAAALGWLIYAVAEPELHFDAGGSVSAGTPVFRTRGKLLAFGHDQVHAGGVTNAGVVLLADIPAYGDVYARRAFAHERIHVLQEDQLAVLWTDPLARRVTQTVPGIRQATRFLAVNLTTELFRTLGTVIPQHSERPWEMEAIFLAR